LCPACVHFCTQRVGDKLPEKPIILIAEDDAAIQAIIEDALIDGGFEPAIARSGEEATTLLKGRVAAYRAVITDIQLLGRSNGWEVGRAAREVDPHFPVIYMSGVVADQWTIQGVPDSIMLEKPFAPAQLVTALSNLLNRRPVVSEE